MLSGCGILISFWSVLVFSPTLFSLLLLLPYYYCHFCHYCCLLLLLLFPQSFRLCVTGALAGLGMACGARGSVSGRAGFWGALATWVWVQQLQLPGSWAPNIHMQRRLLLHFNLRQMCFVDL